MRIELTDTEVENVIGALKLAAHEANIEANQADIEGYPPSVKSELAFKAGELYLLVDKVKDQQLRFRSKPKGSSGLIDPFDTPEPEKTKPPQGASKYDVRWPNDPVEW